jgi:hypothetical protein
VKKIDREQREEDRWRILRILDAGRPIGCSEQLMLRVLSSVKSRRLTMRDLRRELAYLGSLNLVAVDAEEIEPDNHRVELTPAGIDVFEYAAPAPAGISRPPRE